MKKNTKKIISKMGKIRRGITSIAVFYVVRYKLEQDGGPDCLLVNTVFRSPFPFFSIMWLKINGLDAHVKVRRNQSCQENQ